MLTYLQFLFVEFAWRVAKTSTVPSCQAPCISSREGEVRLNKKKVVTVSIAYLMRTLASLGSIEAANIGTVTQQGDDATSHHVFCQHVVVETLIQPSHDQGI